MTSRFPIFVLVLSFVLILSLALPMHAGAQAASSDAPAETTPEADAETPPIVLYMTSWCPYCRKADDLLNEIEADFVAKDIEKDPQAHKEFLRLGKGSTSIPLIDFDGKTLKGFNPDKIRKMAEEVASSD